MSQKKTVIQGLEPNPNVGKKNNSEHSNFYARSNNASKSRGTIVPGMMDFTAPEASEETPKAAMQHGAPRNTVAGKPVVGFLYSISRTAFGEYWPLCIGRNVIGKNADANVCLAEGTVSDNHAMLVVRQIKSTGGVIAAISDTQSTNGTMINGETIGFTSEECHSGDIITIGDNYELLLILVDAAKQGLKVSEGFIPIDVEADDNGMEADYMDDAPFFGSGKTQPGSVHDYYDGGQGWTNGGNGAAGETVGMDGSTCGNNHGGTIPM